MKYNNYILAIFLFSSFNFSMNLSLVDFDDPSAHHILDAEIINDVLIVSGMIGGIEFYDISNPYNLNHLDNLTLSGGGGGGQGGGTKPNCIAASGNYLYVTTNRGIGIINISNPSNPQYLGVISGTNGYLLEDLDVYGNILAVSAHEDGVLIYDVSSPANPQLQYTIPTNNSWTVSLDENYIYVADQSTIIKYDYGSSEFSDMLELSNSIKDIYISEYIYVALGSGGVSVINKNNFLLIDTYNTSALANKLDVVNFNGEDIIAISDWDDVEVLKMINNQLDLVGFKNTTKRTMSVAMKDNFIYSAEWAAVQAFEFGEIDGPDIDLDVYELNYPYTNNGESYTLNVEVTNNGNEILDIVDAYTTNGEFSYTSLNDLNPGESQIIEVTYTANSNNASGSYRIISNDGDEPEIICETNGNINGANIGQEAPDFELDVMANGLGSFSLSDNLGKIIVIAFFAPN